MPLLDKDTLQLRRTDPYKGFFWTRKSVTIVPQSLFTANLLAMGPREERDNIQLQIETYEKGFR